MAPIAIEDSNSSSPQIAPAISASHNCSVIHAMPSVASASPMMHTRNDCISAIDFAGSAADIRIDRTSLRSPGTAHAAPATIIASAG